MIDKILVYHQNHEKSCIKIIIIIIIIVVVVEVVEMMILISIINNNAYYYYKLPTVVHLNVALSFYYCPCISLAISNASLNVLLCCFNLLVHLSWL